MVETWYEEHSRQKNVLHIFKKKGQKSVDAQADLINRASGIGWTELDYLSALLFIF